MADGWRAVPEMVGKALRATRPAHYPLIASDGQRHFPLDWRELARPSGADGGVHVGTGSIQYLHPVATCFNLIARAQSARLSQTETQFEAIQAGLHALLQAQGADGSFRYPVPVPRYGLQPGWSSALAQGLFVAAVSETVDRLNASDRGRAYDAVGAAVDHMMTPVDKGGCTVTDELGIFLEECPKDKPPYILNGAALAVIGLSCSSDASHRMIADEAAESLARRMGAWDLGYWSRYDLQDPSPSSPDYHALHVSVIRALDGRFPDAGFDEWAIRFADQASSPVNRGRALGSLAVRRVLDVARGRR
ncbi:hypothetical protein GCM10022399_30980 [Terrabacter ginsenosidimutans]|uniref:D-glucuronyl C5-epimerase C-terminal domain-containing protein n=1 Tax=Terrabacter ginsenosidimutans TaxID=490575 RepID=A0ABP7DYX1_9MICO